MKRGRLSVALLLSAWLAGCVQPPPAVPPKPPPTAAETAARLEAEAAAVARAAQDARVDEARQLAEEAYIYGYPLVLGEMVRQQMSATDKPEGTRVPANSFWHARQLPPAAEPHPLVGDADTLASFAWLDLGREAMLVTHPAMGRRWFSVALHSQWMQALESAGSGLGDSRAARLLVTGPEWTGSVPAGARHVRSPTRHVLVSVRVQTSGSAADLRAVRALQSQMRIVPQTVRGRGARVSAGSSEPAAIAVPRDSARQRVQALDTGAYFDLLAQLMGSSAPPAAADARCCSAWPPWASSPASASHRRAGARVQTALADTRARALQALHAPPVPGGWQLLPPQTEVGTDPARRAAVALAAWPGEPPARQLLVMRTRVDADGQTLQGAHDYRLVFGKDQQPPVSGFWSLTLQADDGGTYRFVPSSAERVSVGTRDKRADADGTLPLFVQNLSPSLDQPARWLPAPKGEFVLTLRLYLPRTAPPSALPPDAASWAAPPVRRLP